nr:LytTR family DNA-binding domain-containing protein [uncultured Eisenbergiella sp.]
MVRIAVCDDVREMLGILSEMVGKEAERLSEPFEICCFTKGNCLLEAHHKKPFQIIFLDISMPGMNGFEAAGRIGEMDRDSKPFLVFVTSREELVFDSFDYRPFYFVRKRDMDGMYKDMEKIFDKVREYRLEEKEFILELPYNRKRSVLCRDILYLISDGNYMVYILNTGENIKIRGTMRDTEKELEDYHFVRIHKRILVNMSYIQTIDTAKNEVFGDKIGYLEIGRNYKRDILEKYFAYTRSVL